MKTYKLLRLIRGKLYPLYVNANQEMPTCQWIDAEVGQLADENHVRSRLGPLALRPGFHSCEVPFTDWIGRKGGDGKLYHSGREQYGANARLTEIVCKSTRGVG